jgi:hypothetical protein
MNFSLEITLQTAGTSRNITGSEKLHLNLFNAKLKINLHL